MLLAIICVLVTASASGQAKNSAAESPLMSQLNHALTLAKHGDQQGAMSLTLQMIEQHPRFEPAVKLKGMLLEEAGKTTEAQAAYERALTLSPNDGDVLLKTGMYKLASGDTDQSIKLLQHCLRVLPGDGDAEFYLAQAYHRNGQDDQALAAIRKSLKAEPENPAIWQKYGELLCGTGDCQGGLAWLLKAQHADATLPRLNYDIAAADFKSMDLAGAAQYAERAVAADPNDISALQLLASADVKLSNWANAQDAFRKILSFHANEVDALLGLGQCEVELKNFNDAVPTLQSVLRLDPTRLLAHFYLSRAYAGLGNAEEAHHESALHQRMMEQMTFVRASAGEERESPIRGDAQKLIQDHREAEAVKLYQDHFKGTSATPADAYVFVGKLELLSGNTEGGLRDLHHALELQPNVRGAHTYEGILALKRGDLDKAEKEFEAELAIDPSSQMAIAEMGEVRYHQGRWSEAAEQLAKSKTMTPELLYMLCDADFHLGKIDDADLTAETMPAFSKNDAEVMKGVLALLVKNGQSDLAQRLSANLTP